MPLTRSLNGINAYENFKSAYGNTALYNELGGDAGFSDAIASNDENTLNLFMSAVTSADALGGIAAFKADYNTQYLTNRQTLSAVANELWQDRNETKTYERYKKDDNGNYILNDDGSYQTESYEDTVYNYTKESLQNLAADEKERQDAEARALEKDSMNWFAKAGLSLCSLSMNFLATVGDTFKDGVMFLEKAVESLWNKGALRKYMSNETGYGAGALSDLMADFDTQYTFLRDSNGTTTTVGGIFYGISNTFGEMVPTMLMQYATSAIGGAIGKSVLKGATDVAKTSALVAENMKGASTAIGLSYWYNLGVSNVKDYVEASPNASMAQICLTGFTVAAVQGTVTFIMGKTIGSTLLDKVTLGTEFAGSDAMVTSISKPGFTSGLKHFFTAYIKDAYRQAVEEEFQELGQYLVEQASQSANSKFNAVFEISSQQFFNAAAMAFVTSFISVGFNYAKEFATRLNSNEYKINEKKLNELGGWSHVKNVSDVIEYTEKGKHKGRAKYKKLSVQESIDIKNLMSSLNEEANNLEKLLDGFADDRYTQAVQDYEAKHKEAIDAKHEHDSILNKRKFIRDDIKQLNSYIKQTEEAIKKYKTENKGKGRTAEYQKTVNDLNESLKAAQTRLTERQQEYNELATQVTNTRTTANKAKTAETTASEAVDALDKELTKAKWDSYTAKEKNEIKMRLTALINAIQILGEFYGATNDKAFKSAVKYLDDFNRQHETQRKIQAAGGYVKYMQNQLADMQLHYSLNGLTKLYEKMHHAGISNDAKNVTNTNKGQHLTEKEAAKIVDDITKILDEEDETKTETTETTAPETTTEAVSEMPVAEATENTTATTEAPVITDNTNPNPPSDEAPAGEAPSSEATASTTETTPVAEAPTETAKPKTTKPKTTKPKTEEPKTEEQTEEQQNQHTKNQRTAQKISDLAKKTRADEIIIASDGTGIISEDITDKKGVQRRVIVIPKSIAEVKTTNQMLVMAEERDIIYDIADSKIFQKLAPTFRELYQKIYAKNNNVNDVTDETLIANLLYNHSFIQLCLYVEQKNLFQFVAQLPEIFSKYTTKHKLSTKVQEQIYNHLSTTIKRTISDSIYNYIYYVSDGNITFARLKELGIFTNEELTELAEISNEKYTGNAAYDYYMSIITQDTTVTYDDKGHIIKELTTAFGAPNTRIGVLETIHKRSKPRLNQQTFAKSCFDIWLRDNGLTYRQFDDFLSKQDISKIPEALREELAKEYNARFDTEVTATSMTFNQCNMMLQASLARYAGITYTYKDVSRGPSITITDLTVTEYNFYTGETLNKNEVIPGTTQPAYVNGEDTSLAGARKIKFFTKDTGYVDTSLEERASSAYTIDYGLLFEAYDDYLMNREAKVSENDYDEATQKDFVKWLIETNSPYLQDIELLRDVMGKSFEFTFTNVAQARSIIDSIIDDSLDPDVQGYVNINDIIYNPDLLNDEIKDAIIKRYGAITPSHVFFYLKKYILAETIKENSNTPVSIIRDGTGNFTLVTLDEITNVMSDRCAEAYNKAVDKYKTMNKSDFNGDVLFTDDALSIQRIIDNIDTSKAAPIYADADGNIIPISNGSQPIGMMLKASDFVKGDIIGANNLDGIPVYYVTDKAFQDESLVAGYNHRGFITIYPRSDIDSFYHELVHALQRRNGIAFSDMSNDEISPADILDEYELYNSTIEEMADDIRQHNGNHYFINNSESTTDTAIIYDYCYYLTNLETQARRNYYLINDIFPTTIIKTNSAGIISVYTPWGNVYQFKKINKSSKTSFHALRNNTSMVIPDDTNTLYKRASRRSVFTVDDKQIVNLPEESAQDYNNRKSNIQRATNRINEEYNTLSTRDKQTLHVIGSTYMDILEDNFYKNNISIADIIKALDNLTNNTSIRNSMLYRLYYQYGFNNKYTFEEFQNAKIPVMVFQNDSKLKYQCVSITNNVNETLAQAATEYIEKNHPSNIDKHQHYRNFTQFGITTVKVKDLLFINNVNNAVVNADVIKNKNIDMHKISVFDHYAENSGERRDILHALCNAGMLSPDVTNEKIDAYYNDLYNNMTENPMYKGKELDDILHEEYNLINEQRAANKTIPLNLSVDGNIVEDVIFDNVRDSLVYYDPIENLICTHMLFDLDNDLVFIMPVNQTDTENKQRVIIKNISTCNNFYTKGDINDLLKNNRAMAPMERALFAAGPDINSSQVFCIQTISDITYISDNDTGDTDTYDCDTPNSIQLMPNIPGLPARIYLTDIDETISVDDILLINDDYFKYSNAELSKNIDSDSNTDNNLGTIKFSDKLGTIKFGNSISEDEPLTTGLEHATLENISSLTFENVLKLDNDNYYAEFPQLTFEEQEAAMVELDKALSSAIAILDLLYYGDDTQETEYKIKIYAETPLLEDIDTSNAKSLENAIFTLTTRMINTKAAMAQDISHDSVDFYNTRDLSLTIDYARPIWDLIQIEIMDIALEGDRLSEITNAVWQFFNTIHKTQDQKTVTYQDVYNFVQNKAYSITEIQEVLCTLYDKYLWSANYVQGTNESEKGPYSDGLYVNGVPAYDDRENRVNFMNNYRYPNQYDGTVDELHTLYTIVNQALLVRCKEANALLANHVQATDIIYKYAMMDSITLNESLDSLTDEELSQLLTTLDNNTDEASEIIDRLYDAVETVYNRHHNKIFGTPANWDNDRLGLVSMDDDAMYMREYKYYQAPVEILNKSIKKITDLLNDKLFKDIKVVQFIPKPLALTYEDSVAFNTDGEWNNSSLSILNDMFKALPTNDIVGMIIYSTTSQVLDTISKSNSSTLLNYLKTFEDRNYNEFAAVFNNEITEKAKFIYNALITELTNRLLTSLYATNILRNDNQRQGFNHKLLDTLTIDSIQCEILSYIFMSDDIQNKIFTSYKFNNAKLEYYMAECDILQYDLIRDSNQIPELEGKLQAVYNNMRQAKRGNDAGNPDLPGETFGKVSRKSVAITNSKTKQKDVNELITSIRNKPEAKPKTKSGNTMTPSQRSSARAARLPKLKTVDAVSGTPWKAQYYSNGNEVREIPATRWKGTNIERLGFGRSGDYRLQMSAPMQEFIVSLDTDKMPRKFIEAIIDANDTKDGRVFNEHDLYNWIRTADLDKPDEMNDALFKQINKYFFMFNGIDSLDDFKKYILYAEQYWVIATMLKQPVEQDGLAAPDLVGRKMSITQLTKLIKSITDNPKLAPRYYTLLNRVNRMSSKFVRGNMRVEILNHFDGSTQSMFDVVELAYWVGRNKGLKVPGERRTKSLETSTNDTDRPLNETIGAEDKGFETIEQDDTIVEALDISYTEMIDFIALYETQKHADEMNGRPMTKEDQAYFSNIRPELEALLYGTDTEAPNKQELIRRYFEAKGEESGLTVEEATEAAEAAANATPTRSHASIYHGIMRVGNWLVQNCSPKELEAINNVYHEEIFKNGKLNTAKYSRIKNDAVLEEFYEKLMRIRDEQKQKSFENKQRMKQLEKLEEQYAALQERGKREKNNLKDKLNKAKEQIKSLKEEIHGLTAEGKEYNLVLNVNEGEEVPEALKRLLKITIENPKTHNRTVQFVPNDDTENTTLSIEEFFATNREVFDSLNNETMCDIIAYLGNHLGSPDGDIDSVKIYNVATLWTLAYMKQLVDNNRLILTDDELHALDKAYSDRASLYGSGLNAVKQAIGRVNPKMNKITIINALRSANIEVPDNVVDELVTALDLNDGQMLTDTFFTEHHLDKNKVKKWNQLSEVEVTPELRQELAGSAVQEITRIALENVHNRRGYERVMNGLLAFEQTCLLSWPGTWLRNLTSNVILKEFNRLGDWIGKGFTSGKRMQERINKKWGIINERAHSDDARYKDYKDVFLYTITGTKVSKDTKAAVQRFMNTPVYTDENGNLVTLYKSVEDGLTRYNDVMFNTAHRNSSTGETLSELIISSISLRVFNHHKFDTISDSAAKQRIATMLNKVSVAMFKMLSDDPFIKQTTTYLFERMCTEREINPGKISINNTQAINIFAEAYSEAAYQYIHRNSFLKRLEADVKHRGVGGVTGWFVLKQFMPFMNATWNWGVEAINYSPYGLVKGITQIFKLEKTFDKNVSTYSQVRGAPSYNFTLYNARQTLGKGVIGTALMAFGAALAALGVVALDEDDDKMKLYFGGNTYIDVSGVFGTSSFLAGAAIIWDIFKADSEDGVGDRLWTSFMSCLDYIFEDTLFNDLFNSFRYSNSIGDWLSYNFLNVFGNFIPNFWKQAIQSTHNYEINYSSGVVGQLQRIATKLLPAQWVPGVEKQYDPYTGEVKYKYKAAWFINLWNRLSPIDIEPYEVSEVEMLAVSLGVNKGQLTGRYEDIGELTNKQKAILNQMYGQLNKQELNNLIRNKKAVTVENDDGTFSTLKWSKMTDIQKAAAITSIMNKNASYAKIYVYTSKMGGKYYASDSEYTTLKSLGIRGNIYRETGKYKGFV